MYIYIYACIYIYFCLFVRTYVCMFRIYTAPSCEPSSSPAQKHRMSLIVGSTHKKFGLKSRTEMVQMYEEIICLMEKLVQSRKPGDTKAMVATLNKFWTMTCTFIRRSRL